MTNVDAALPVVVSHAAGVTTMTIHGRVDHDSVPSIGQSLGEAVDTDADQIIINLRDVNFIDTAGLRLLITASEMFHRQERVLILSDPTPPVSRALATCSGPSNLIVLATEAVAQPISSPSTTGQLR
jgi:anti-anti-sigma factor